MGKANISFPEGMLEEIDRRAAEAGTTRSGFIQEATSAYITRIDEDAEREERRKRIERAQEHMAEIGKRMQPGPDGVTIIRQFRDALPEWLTDRERTDDE
jgi:metal-responsive CopG/Arc/MetJ family transcriptional regulator